MRQDDHVSAGSPDFGMHRVLKVSTVLECTRQSGEVSMLLPRGNIVLMHCMSCPHVMTLVATWAHMNMPDANVAHGMVQRGAERLVNSVLIVTLCTHMLVCVATEHACHVSNMISAASHTRCTQVQNTSNVHNV
jgi:hypothetical protein